MKIILYPEDISKIVHDHLVELCRFHEVTCVEIRGAYPTAEFKARHLTDEEMKNAWK